MASKSRLESIIKFQLTYYKNWITVIVELKLIVIVDSVEVKTCWKQEIWIFVKQNLQTVFIVLKAFERL